LGYLGEEPGEIAALLARYSLGAVGGFVPLSLHDRNKREEAEAAARSAARLISGAGGSYFVTAIVVDEQWSKPFEPEPAQWDELAEEVAMVGRICAEHGLSQVVHPHIGTLIERSSHVDQLMRRSEVSWCLDTGHLAVGGTDPVRFAEEHVGQVGLVHLKDVNLSLAPKVLEHEMSLLEATRRGLFQPLGRGDVNVAAVVRALEAGGYKGWYVLEQDTTIEPEAASSVAPKDDVKASIEHLASQLSRALSS
ncbi:MAG: sugar phosphate isomerase/epimerase family protein, partial [Acidimicrobiales bacterium]